jgi:signal peptidase I
VPGRALLAQLREWVVVVVVAIVVAVGVRTVVVQQFYIAGPSMETTLASDDRVLVNKLAYRWGSPSRGDVVVFDRITTDGEVLQHDDLIKRVIAVGGETVELRDCALWVDGARVDEPWLSARGAPPDPADDLVAACGQPQMDPVRVPAGQVFLMGDNRAMSFDSRQFGPVDLDVLVGRAFVVIWPARHWTGL